MGHLSVPLASTICLAGMIDPLMLGVQEDWIKDLVAVCATGP